MSDLSTAWGRLTDAAANADGRRIASLFDAEPDRLDRLTVAAAGLELELSKQPWSLTDLDVCLGLAKTAQVEAARARFFAGEPVNTSEHRAALHMALRAPKGSDFKADGEPVSPAVDAMRDRMATFANDIRSGAHKGATGKPFRKLIHIGIGGSDFGPRLVWEALRPVDPQIEVRYVANVDPADLTFALHGLDPAETMVVVVSKTFTTQETMTNAKAARDWLRAALGKDGDKHLVAVSAALKETAAFGVPDEHVFGFGDWVGGRYSVWSPVGLSCVIGLGPEIFERLLSGAAAMDAHFQSAPLAANAPVLLALAHVFNRNGLGRPVRAVVPYGQRLHLLPNFLQQLEMESNGKHITKQGLPAPHHTAQAVFGDAGTNVQHAFFQLMHQGTDIIPTDFIAIREAAAGDGDPAAQRILVSNVIAQAEALMVGKSEAQVREELTAKGVSEDELKTLAPQRTFDGNRPSAFILLDRLDPESLGALLVLYEHKVFVEGVLWEINSFDQWGVELGKSLATKVLGELNGGPAGVHDPSTTRLIGKLKAGKAGA